ncbi:fibronectin type III domain-containing protein 5 isoform X2 [Xyrauchen texanus]|uniref:fibronectin type III domain-containing protein 5 isoform X2 n=1 Tax=Xyrauchen texanus TaxID=154827 RepID=UPI0022421F1C|nr:fibronectin type III domain-containing protein 5 isoform X2 [Xyrauchen texanus]
MWGIKGSCSALLLLFMAYISVSSVNADSLSAPLNVTIKALEGNSAIVTWEILEGDPVIGFAITQQKKDVRMLRFIQEVNTTTRSCALWDLEEDTEYIVHVQSISMSGTSPPSEPVLFRTPKESEKLASKSPAQRHHSDCSNHCLPGIYLGLDEGTPPATQPSQDRTPCLSSHTSPCSWVQLQYRLPKRSEI